ncbi:MAG: hypothetical protein EXX96DRAFT_591897 [Benjaminiella poitrasii]|nr:MAG: hypothetical protein EXX96DRAFT_591897 [Benjaminiella poitrasii]
MVLRADARFVLLLNKLNMNSLSHPMQSFFAYLYFRICYIFTCYKPVFFYSWIAFKLSKFSCRSSRSLVESITFVSSRKKLNKKGKIFLQSIYIIYVYLYMKLHTNVYMQHAIIH